MEYDEIIIGGGIIGSATAYNLTKRDKNVLLIDQFKINEAFNQSNDYSRFFRYAYGKDTHHTKLAVQSLKLWKELERQSGKRLYFRTGFLMLGNSMDRSMKDSYLTLKRLGHKVEMLDTIALNRRYPQFNAKYGVLDYNGGVLSASAAVNTYLSIAKKQGLNIKEGVRVKGIKENYVILANGEKIGAKKIFVAAGFWINSLIKNKYQIRTTRQEVFYIQPEKPGLFKKDKFPLFQYAEKGEFYGIPIHGIDAVKVALELNKVADPMKVDKTIGSEAMRQIKISCKKYIPELASGKIIEKNVCMYDNSPDGNFIIDKPNKYVIVATGFSGGGFKFAPVIGKRLADLCS